MPGDAGGKGGQGVQLHATKTIRTGCKLGRCSLPVLTSSTSSILLIWVKIRHLWPPAFRRASSTASSCKVWKDTCAHRDVQRQLRDASTFGWAPQLCTADRYWRGTRCTVATALYHGTIWKRPPQSPPAAHLQLATIKLDQAAVWKEQLRTQPRSVQQTGVRIPSLRGSGSFTCLRLRLLHPNA